MHSGYLLLSVTAAMAGAINSIAGGGTLLTFPVLMALLAHQAWFAARAPVVANQTSTMALIPGIFAAAWGYRRQLVHSRAWLKRLLLPSAAGGLIGGVFITQVPAPRVWFLGALLVFLAAVVFFLQPPNSQKNRDVPGPNEA